MYEINEANSGDNIGGISTLEIAHVNDLSSAFPIVFKPNCFWRTVNFHPFSGQFKEEIVGSDHGIYYSYSGSVKVIFLKKEEEKLFKRYFGICSILKITDQNGIVYIIGGLDYPVTLLKAFDSGSNPTDPNQTQFSFSIQQIKQAIIA